MHSVRRGPDNLHIVIALEVGVARQQPLRRLARAVDQALAGMTDGCKAGLGPRKQRLVAIGALRENAGKDAIGARTAAPLGFRVGGGVFFLT